MRSCSQPCRAFMNSFERTRDRFVYRCRKHFSTDFESTRSVLVFGRTSRSDRWSLFKLRRKSWLYLWLRPGTETETVAGTDTQVAKGKS